jgi:hypothetical protein
MKSFRITFLAFLASIALSISARGGPILVGEWAGADSGDAEELATVQGVIAFYNFVVDPDLPAFAGLSEFVPKTEDIDPYLVGDDDKTIIWTAPNDHSFYYIMTKWGKGGANFDHALHYVLAGETLNYNPGGSNPPEGLSHVWIWAPGGNQVPDGGSTVALMGASLAGLAMIRRRK